MSSGRESAARSEVLKRSPRFLHMHRRRRPPLASWVVAMSGFCGFYSMDSSGCEVPPGLEFHSDVPGERQTPPDVRVRGRDWSTRVCAPTPEGRNCLKVLGSLLLGAAAARPLWDKTNENRIVFDHDATDGEVAGVGHKVQLLLDSHQRVDAYCLGGR